MDSVSGTSICTYRMCCRFQIGSKRPLANRNARMLSTDSLPRKWSMRNTCDSSKTSWVAAFSARADSRSTPNGFSMITREALVASPDEPSILITDVNAAGGTARWNSRRTELAPPALPEPPIADSAALTADTNGDGSSGDAAPNDRQDANFSHAEPAGFTLANWATA